MPGVVLTAVASHWVVGAALCLPISNLQSPISNLQEPPLVGQPTENFYGAQGSRVKVAWSLDRTSVRLDEEIVATLTITNATNPQKITRPDLKKLPAFQALFTIVDNPDPLPAVDAKAVKFTYRLRPRDRDVKKVPTFEFHYYNPAAAQGKQYPLTTTGRAIEIAVTAPAPKAAPPVVPLGEPEHLFAIATGPAVLEGEPLVPGGWACAAAALLGPVLALGWYLIWRRVFPDAARLAKMRRSRAARRAVDSIRRAGRTPDPAATLANAVLGYLRARFPLPPGAVTPIEIGSALAELGVRASDCDAATAFFRECDAARFSLSSDNGMSLTSDAEALVTRLEAA
jgi:hypothetical protein